MQKGLLNEGSVTKAQLELRNNGGVSKDEHDSLMIQR
jgi:hypothetical protein